MLTKENAKKAANANKTRKPSKKEIYASFGIEYDPATGKILCPLYGWQDPLLIDGNTKLGKGVYTWSMLPGDYTHTVYIDGEKVCVKGTCLCNCKGCYAQTGNYNFSTVKAANARKTVLARTYPDFIKRAIIAQIKADKIKLCRIHASGEFFDDQYIMLWHDIVTACPECLFWSYTKNAKAEAAFDDCENCNIVKSIISGYGFNYGECGYILKVYQALKALGKAVYICRCGIDKNQHCTTCKGCASNEIVLFIEHSTKYVAEKDPLFPVLKAVIDGQDINIANAAD